MDHVDHTLKLWRSTPFEWGQRDCMLSIGDYIASRGGLDVTGYFRGTYSTQAGAMAHVEGHGGLTALIDLTGLFHTDDPQRGDVVILDTGFKQVGALCTGDGIAARLERGIAEVNIEFVNIIQAWKVP